MGVFRGDWLLRLVRAPVAVAAVTGKPRAPTGVTAVSRHEGGDRPGQQEFAGLERAEVGNPVRQGGGKTDPRDLGLQGRPYSDLRGVNRRVERCERQQLHRLTLTHA